MLADSTIQNDSIRSQPFTFAVQALPSGMLFNVLIMPRGITLDATPNLGSDRLSLVADSRRAVLGFQRIGLSRDRKCGQRKNNNRSFDKTGAFPKRLPVLCLTDLL
jgi:hypothetical protein